MALPKEYLPTKHARQSVCADLLTFWLNLPAAHHTGDADASGQYAPAGHGRHQSAEVAPVAELNVPALQFTNVVDASGQ